MSRYADFESELGGFQPIRDRVLVVRDVPPDIVRGIYVPEVAREKPCEGFVLAVGPQVRDVRPKDKVIWREGKRINSTHDILHEDEILCVVTP